MARSSDQSAGNGQDGPLRELLALGERTRRNLPQQLRHRIGVADPSLFDDELVARTRGLLVDLTEQLAGDRPYGLDTGAHLDGRDAILRALFDQPALLAHCHGLALEFRLMRRLAKDADIDSLLPPVLQELIASPMEEVSRLASAALAAQTRFIRNMERMQLPLRQLPGELLHVVLGIGRERLKDMIVSDAVEHAVRTSYDEGATRLALFARLANKTDYLGTRGWQLEEAGVPLFLASLSMADGQGHYDAVLLTTQSQMVRLALTLRTLGCNPRAVNRNLYLLHDEIALPVIAGIEPGTASAMLAESIAGRGARDAA